MNYIYKITCIPNGRMYIGQHSWKGEGLDKNYFGSPTNPDFDADLELYPDTDKDWSNEILEVVEDVSQLADRETYWIGQWFDGGKVCYNLNPQGGGGWIYVNNHPEIRQKAYETNKQNGTGCFDPEVQSKAGKKGGQSNVDNHTGFCGRSSEKMSEDGKKATAKAKELGVGFYGMTSEEHSEAGKKGGATTYERGVGLFGRSEEQFLEDSKKGGDTCVREKRGIFAADSEQKSEWSKKGADALTFEQRSEAGRKGGNSNKENHTGVCGRSPEKMSEDAKKAAAASNIKFDWYDKETCAFVCTCRKADATKLSKKSNRILVRKEELTKQ